MISFDKTKHQLWQGLWALLGLILILASSCNRSIYSPNEAYLMGVSKKGDLKVSGSFFGLDKEYHQTSFLGAFSPVKHFSVVASHFNKGSNQDYNTFYGYDNWKVKMNEVALGFYNKKINPRTEKQYFLYDVYAGMGWGNVLYNFIGHGEMNILFRRQFLQNNFHFWLSPHIGVSFGLRFARLQYLNANLFGAIPLEQITLVDFVKVNDPFFIIEPSMQYTAGFQYFKCFLSCTGLNYTKKGSYRFGQNQRLGDSLIKFGLIMELDDLFDWAKKL